MKLTIRLKLTLWYLVILVVTTVAFLLAVNVVWQQQVNKSPEEIFEQVEDVRKQEFTKRWEGGVPNTPTDVRYYIDEIRQHDLAEARNTSLVIFIVLMFASAAGGYFIAGKLLKPIRDINTATHIIDADNLHISLPNINPDDELGELVQNFNAMLERLNGSFDLQKQFVENASHELKTPLTIVQTNIELILRDSSLRPDEQREYLRRVLVSANFMNTLIEDLLLLSVTKEHVQFDEVAIDDVVVRSVQQLQPIAQNNNKQLRYTIGKELVESGGLVQGNATLLQRAVMNCVENAIKYAKQDIDVSITQPGSSIHITVKDDGPGIPKSEHDKIWERFYRADTSRSRQTGGSGLGLAITKSIVELHNGAVKIDSTEGEGTTISIVIPM